MYSRDKKFSWKILVEFVKLIIPIFTEDFREPFKKKKRHSC